MHLRVAALLVLGILTSPARAADEAKAAALLSQARAALGGEAALTKIQGLTAIGRFTRQMPDRPQVGDVQLDLQLPDRLLRTRSLRSGDADFVSLEGVNGETVLRTAKIINGGPGARMSQPPLAGGSETTALRSARQHLAGLTFALFAGSRSIVPLTFAYGGEAVAPEGKADVIDATGPDGIVGRLFLDKASHRPLMLTYRDFDPRMFLVASRPGQAQAAPAAAPTLEPASPLRLVLMTLFLDDYREAGGVMLPHRLTREVDGALDEEWQVKTYRLNPAFKADAFSGK